MRNNKGFTLLELLIAAAIIGVLAMMATQAFRVSSAEVRLRDAMVRARAVAIAGRRFKIEHRDATYDTAPMGIVVMGIDQEGSVCRGNNLTINLTRLVKCGYLDYRRYVDTKDFSMQFNSDGDVCVQPQSGTKAAVLGSKFYCTDGENEWTPQ